MTAVAGAEVEATAVDLGSRRFERSDRVFWTRAFPGIVLHNYERREFLSLNELGYRLWSYLDGARPIRDAVAAARGDGSEADPAVELEQLWEMVTTLVEHGFVVERASDE